MHRQILYKPYVATLNGVVLIQHINKVELSSIVYSASDFRSRGHEFEPQLDHITSIEIDHEMISMVILRLTLIQEWQLSVTGGNCPYCVS